jgi:hypothetical protein
MFPVTNHIKVINEENKVSLFRAKSGDIPSKRNKKVTLSSSERAEDLMGRQRERPVVQVVTSIVVLIGCHQRRAVAVCRYSPQCLIHLENAWRMR